MRTPSDVYSRALLLTSTRADPAIARVVLQTSALELAHTARRTALPIRQVSRPRASDADEKPLPCTVIGVPPSASTLPGDTKLTLSADWYSYVAPLSMYC